MAIWNRNKVPPANLNAGQQYNAEDWTSEQTFNVANNNAFYSVDFAEALADAPDNTEAGNIGTPTVTLIDNVKTIDGTPKTFKKFKFANLKGEKGDAGINDALVVQTFGTSTEDAISQKVITDKFDELDDQLNSVPISDTSYGLIEAFENAETAVMQNLLLHGLTVTNLITNGNFADGTTGWSGSGATLSIVSGNLRGTSDGTSITPRIFNSTGTRCTASANDKIYLRLKVRVNNNNATRIDLFIQEYYNGSFIRTQVNVTIVTNPIQDQWYEIDNVYTLTSNIDFNHVIIRIAAIYPDLSTSNGKTHEIKGGTDGVLLVNLTDTFGAGNEPDLATCQSKFPSYFDGTISVDKGEVTIGTGTSITRARYPKLQSVPAIQDTFDVLTGLHTQNVIKQILTGSEDWVTFTSRTQVNTIAFRFTLNPVSSIALTEGYIPTNLSVIGFNNISYLSVANSDIEGVSIRTFENRLYLCVLRSKLATEDLSGFLTWLGANNQTLYYQLATPILTYYPPKSIPLEINSSIIHQSIMSDIAFYSTGIAITDSDYPIETLQEVILVNTDDGTETLIDIATCTVASGGLSFTSTALTDGDLVWFRYEHTLDSTVPTTDYTYTTSLSGGLATIQQDVKKQNESLQKQIDELRTVIQSLSI